MDFVEAEQRFRMLEEQRARGILTLEQYRAEINRLRVKDAYGRLWMPQEQTGRWFVHHNGQWQAATPPHQTAPASHAPVVPERAAPQSTPQVQSGGGVSFDTPTSYGGAPTQQPVTPQTDSAGVSFDPTPEQAATLHSQPASFQPSVNAPLPRLRKPKPAQVRRAAKVAYSANQARTGGQRTGMGCVGTLLAFAIGYPLVFGIIGVVVYYLSGENEEALMGVALALVISLFISMFSVLAKWEGTVMDIRTVRESSTDDDGYTSYRNVTYAFVQKPNGKTKKVKRHKKWQVGDYLEKRRGEFGTRHYPR